MSDWQVGDRAVRFLDGGCQNCIDNPPSVPVTKPAGGVVVATDPPQFSGDTWGLRFVGDGLVDEMWCSCAYRKIRPDEQEACEPEFVTLLKRSKRKVSA